MPELIFNLLISLVVFGCIVLVLVDKKNKKLEERRIQLFRGSKPEIKPPYANRIKVK